ncbi:hypothetical protein [Candidatus Chloroploca sp. Khr17]|uniref:hypothetical protein n=1 Tax=Candidatus Chloroploca sp. Khr17 TaxID=2496869 RepID=UPI00101DF773|nr:hypothetical protein [Candidatus Chloroploca sp. Khr17]
MDDVFAIMFWTSFLCCFPVLIIGGSVGFVVYRNTQRRAASAAIAQGLGLQPTARAKQMQWYEGRLRNGRLCAYVPIIFKRTSYNHEGQRRSSYVSAARLVLEVKREQPLHLNVFRHENWSQKRAPLDSFATAFAADNGSKLTSSQQAALLGFAQAYPGATIWLSDRAGASTDVFNAPEVMAGTTSFLLFEYQVVNPSPEEIQVKVVELSRLASLFET